MPAGADARTSIGPGCKTPCSVAVQAPDTGFSVTYTLNKYEPATIPVQVIRTPGDFVNAGDDDVRSQPGGCAAAAGRPAAQGRPEKADEPKKPKAPKGTAAAPAPAGSPFPDPNQPPPPGQPVTPPSR